jgi:nitrate/TMAO reductase-like tetraheme cytochrome c subunit
VIRSRRSKPRPGRLKGAEMTALRDAAYERDCGRCINCGTPVRREEFDLSHARGKRMWGDSVENVRVKCMRCHRVLEHHPKAVPSKRRLAE